MDSTVAALEREYAGRLNVRRVHFGSDEGRRLRRAGDVSFTPTFLFVRPSGERTGRIFGVAGPARMRDEVERLLADRPRRFGPTP